MTECRVEITQGVICVLDILSEKLEFLLAHEEEETDPDRDIEQIFVRVLSDRTADYMQISRELSELGWGGNHEYMCLILQITYLNQQNLSTKAISRYIKKKLGDSVSFLYQDEIVVFFDLTRLGMNQEEVAGKLVYQRYLSESRVQQSNDGTHEPAQTVCTGENSARCRKP